MTESTHTPLAAGTLRAADIKQPPVGIDIGGTKINAAIVRPNFETRQENIQGLMNAPTPVDDPDAFLDTLVRMIQSLRQEYNAGMVGISTAGVVDSTRGKILGSTGNLPALSRIADLKALLEARTGLKVHVENDANAAAYGEWRSGSAFGAENMFAITLGTGVGMGMVVDRKMYRGSHFFAAEGGHIAIAHTRERQCTCGRWDCWEAFASGRGLEITASQVLAAADPASHDAFINRFAPNAPVTTYTVVEAVRQQDALGLKMLDHWHRHIAVGLGSMINVLDPDIVVVGGGLAQFVDFDRLRELTAERAMGHEYRVVPAELGNLAGLVGAAYLALETLGA